MVGAAIASLAAASLRLGLLLWFVQIGGLPLPSLSRFWRTLVTADSMAAAVVTVQLPTVWFSIALGSLVYLLAMYLMGAFAFTVTRTRS
jgi:hypothetical protein